MDIEKINAMANELATGFDLAMRKGAFGLGDNETFRPAYDAAFGLIEFSATELPIFVRQARQKVVELEAIINELGKDMERLKEKSAAAEQRIIGAVQVEVPVEVPVSAETVESEQEPATLPEKPQPKKQHLQALPVAAMKKHTPPKPAKK